MTEAQIIVGVDEAGRGPLAGPVYVAAVAVPADFNFSAFPALDDSKQMTEKGRENLYDNINSLDLPKFKVENSYSRPKTIDKVGINPAIQNALNRSLRRLDISCDYAKLLLDGGLKAPDKYEQKTITKGDQKRSVISLASIVAKVARDRKMRQLNDYYPFNFSQHKGYGTKDHEQKIAECGASEIHRKSFL